MNTPRKLENPLYVGRPNIGNREALFARINILLDRRWLTNNGPLVQEFEAKICDYVGVKYCVAMCNATVGLEIASRALGFSGEVIVPSYTFIATAHALQWQGITPIFADIDPSTHNLDPKAIKKAITSRTTGILGVHLWGRACDIESIEKIGEQYGLPVMFDAAHAFGCTYRNKLIGGFGNCEVFSFHATKLINSFEGGAVVTNDLKLAKKMRLMRNFGFDGYDNVIYPGVNGKMPEICAAMGLTSLEAIDEIIGINRRNYEAYQRGLAGFPGINLVEYEPAEQNNFQYVVIEIDQELADVTRDDVVKALHTQHIIARKYFWPGCHRMAPYLSTQPDAGKHLRHTERISDQVIVLPTGQLVSQSMVEEICAVIIRTSRP